MTRANSDQLKYVPWFAKAGAACSIVPIARFVNKNILALKGGGYGCFFQLSGVDEEGLTDHELESQLRISKAVFGECRKVPLSTSTRGFGLDFRFLVKVATRRQACQARSRSHR
jgi:hypothetical protein